jgi:hypothetical protein
MVIKPYKTQVFLYKWLNFVGDYYDLYYDLLWACELRSFDGLLDIKGDVSLISGLLKVV